MRVRFPIFEITLKNQNKKKYSIKVVSDSLNNKTYSNFKFDNELPKVYAIIDQIITE